MSGLLSDLTLYTTFVSLGLTLWFAIYLLSRSRVNPLAFRAIIVLVALAIYYIYLLNTLVTGIPGNYSVRLFAMTIALVAAHDLTFYLLNPEQRKKRYPLARGIILFGMVIIILIFTAPQSQPCDPITICPTVLRFPYLIIEIFNAIVFCSILYNLWLIRKTEGMLNNMAFYLAIFIGIGAVTISFIGTVLNIPMPRFLPNLFILSALILLAYSVVQDRTFVTHRTSTYDLPVSLLTIIVIVLIYILTGRQLKLSGTDLFIIAILAVFTHSAYDFVRDFLDQLVHRQQRLMRRELDTLGRNVSTYESLKRYLSRGLAILCKNLNALGGFIAIRQDDHYSVVASFHSIRIGEVYSVKEVDLENVTQATGSIFPQIAWLAPGYAGSEQIAIIGVGSRKDKIQYAEEDLYWLEDIAHEISQIVYLHLQPRPSLTQDLQAEIGVPAIEESQPVEQGGLLSVLAFKPDLELVKFVEDGYQHLNDYDQLGISPLVELFSIEGGDHLENGKLLHDKLLLLLDKLRPAGQQPAEPLPREWYAYTILYDAYVNDRLSRDTMGKLYIGEGTYYRIRRQALRGITRAIQEMGVSA
ncbi:MAG: hypothetical protein A2Z71_06195 [Chloroflexi bacterium RBG_13_50_21]|nr:MAG: hypothetical protein A2Z71_06195 [Chloroflexi bacterium RBG_13_50_21]